MLMMRLPKNKNKRRVWRDPAIVTQWKELTILIGLCTTSHHLREGGRKALLAIKVAPP